MSPERGKDTPKVDMERLRLAVEGTRLEVEDDGGNFLRNVWHESGPAILELIDAAVEWHADMDGDECVDRLGEAVEPFLPEEEKAPEVAEPIHGAGCSYDQHGRCVGWHCPRCGKPCSMMGCPCPEEEKDA